MIKLCDVEVTGDGPICGLRPLPGHDYDPAKYTGWFGVYRDANGGQPLVTASPGGSIDARLKSLKVPELSNRVGEKLVIMVHRLQPR